jgi:integrase
VASPRSKRHERQTRQSPPRSSPGLRLAKTRGSFAETMGSGTTRGPLGHCRSGRQRGHIRTVPIPNWVREQLECWITAAGIDGGRIFRKVDRSGRVRGDHISVKAIWHIVKKSARKVGLPSVAPHDLSRTCARLCQSAGEELEQIQFLLGHVSIQTTERYLGSKQRLSCAVNDRIGIEPSS